MDKESKISPSPDLLWPTVLTVLLGLFGYAKLMPSLESARPKDTSGKEASAKIEAEGVTSSPARLWEDPLGEVYHDELRRMRAAQRRAAADAQDSESSCDCLLFPWIARLNALAGDTRGQSPEGMLDDVRERPLLLPVMVPGGTIVDDKEHRRKTRYAVTCALATAGYQPSTARQLRYFPLLSDGGGESGNPLLIPYEHFRPDTCRRVYDFNVDNLDYTDVVVCWLDEDEMGDSVLHAVGALRDMFDARPWSRGARVKKQCGVRIIGPYSSDTLLKMVHESAADPEPSTAPRFPGGFGSLLKQGLFALAGADWPDRSLRKVEIYSPRATVEPLALKKDDSPDDVCLPRITLDQVNHFIGRPTKDAEKPYPPVPKFIPIVGTDWHLVHAICNELKLRNAWPRPREGDPAECIVLVTEKDTLYGRSIPLLFASMFPNTLDNRDTGTIPPLLVYKFLRGIDGSPASQSEMESKKARAGDNDQRQADLLAGYQSVGDYQIDYLRRLGDELGRWDRELKKRGGRGILAIGVVGTDVYDKLLFLRALRKRFDRACFFTNDLDDNYSRPAELEYTQNLLVASHFGLTLHPSLQREVAPFRESYQTATFLAVLHAVGDYRVKEILAKRKRLTAAGQEPPLWPVPSPPSVKHVSEAAETLQEPPYGRPSDGLYLKSLVFEIGRRGPYQLTPAGASLPPSPAVPATFATDAFDLNLAVHPPSPRELNLMDARGWFCLIAGVVTLVIILAVNIRFVRDVLGFLFRPVKWLGAEAMNLGRRLWNRETRVPKARLALALVLLLIVVLLALQLWPLLKTLWQDHLDPAGQPFVLISGTSIWPSVILRAVAAVLGIVLVFAGLSKIKGSECVMLGGPDNDADPFKPSTEAQERHHELAHWPKHLPCGKGLRHFRKYLLFWEWRKYDDPRQIMKSYLRFGHPAQRWVRASLWSLVYFSFCFVLMYGLDCVPNQAGRGSVAQWVSRAVLLASVFVMVFICFFVIDTLQLCQRFVRLLGRTTGRWPDKYLANNENETWAQIRKGLGPAARGQNGLTERHIIRAIAKHTHAINKLIWFPFIVLLLLVFARQSIFYAWSYPPALMIVQLLLLLALWFHTWRLRIEADDARDAIICRLRDRLLAANGPKRGALREHLAAMIDDIDREDEGAFSHWTQDYFLKAMSLPLLGEGGFALWGRFLGPG
jgi:hypothetical protein